jgi:hypothetical protein
MTEDRIDAYAGARALAFGATGALLLGLAALALLGGSEWLRLSWWSWPAGLALFAIVLVLGLAGGRRVREAMWDEAATADLDRSQRLAYLAGIVVIFPVLAVAIQLGLDPTRGFVAAGLSLGATQLLAFCALDRMGR